METSRIWRIRLKRAEEEFTAEAWARDEVGIWYGAWAHQDLHRALDQGKNAAEFLSLLPQQQELGWRVSKSYVDTAVRFSGISASDWVFVYFDERLHFARTCSDLQSAKSHPLNGGGEIFKYRSITDKKSFRLAVLPDCFRLLPSAGRGNVHEVHETNRKMVDLLAVCENEDQAATIIVNMPLKDWLAVLGPTAWESLCLGYLILEHGFVPTGLAVGHTLPIFDIVGRDRHGHRILAQCKKNPWRVCVDDRFLEAACRSSEADLYFYFAFGGCSGEIPQSIRVMSNVDIECWLASHPAGQRYLELLRK